MPVRALPLACLVGLVAASPGLTAPRAECVTDRPGIRLNVSGLRDRTGDLRLEVYPANQVDFLADDDDLLRAGKFFRRIVVPSPLVSGSVCVQVPTAGRYAVILIHKRARRAKFDIGQDGAAVPGARRLGFRTPRLAEAQVEVTDHVVSRDVAMQYLHGLSGFTSTQR